MVKNAECVTDSRRAENQTVAFEEAAATCAPVMQGKGRMKRLLVIFCMWKTMRYARTSDGRASADNYKMFAAENFDDAFMLPRSNEFDFYLIDNWIAAQLQTAQKEHNAFSACL